MKKNGVFLLVASFPDSILRFRGALLDELIAAGETVHVVAPGLGSESAFRAQLVDRGVICHSISLHRTGTNPFVDAKVVLQLFLLMRRIRPDRVLAYTVKPVIYGMLAAKLVRVRKRFALITGLGYAFQGGEERVGIRSLVKRLYAFALRGVDKVFFQNPDDEQLFRDIRLLADSQLSFVVNGSGVDLGVYRFSELPPSPRFLLIGRLLGDKGVREYAEAAKRVRELYPQAVFGVVGWIDDNPDSIGKDELDLWVSSGVLDFYGRLEDVRPAISNCTVYVLPSYREGTPRTVLEAMAMGRAIITTDAPGCRETVVDGVNGFLVPVKEVEGLAEAMIRFIEDPGLAKRMGMQSRKIAEEKYDVHQVNSVMLREMEIL